MDLAAERRLIELLARLAEQGRLASAHDLSDGGLAVALAECAMNSGVGVDVALDSTLRPSALLFGETAGRVLVSFGPDEEAAIRSEAERLAVPFELAGRTGGERLRIAAGGRVLIDEGVGALKEIWANSFARAMEAADVL